METTGGTPTLHFFDLSFGDSVTSQQRQWCEDAMAWSRFPWNNSDLVVTVHTVAEPPCPGHADYMCTQSSDGHNDIWIRQGADDPNASFNANVKDEIHLFFAESFIHELGHAFSFQHMASDDESRSVIANWFYLETATGEGNARRGKLADWNPLAAAWEDRVQEGLAEFFKDVYLPDQYRVYENRTHWWMDQQFFSDFVDMIEAVVCPSGTSQS